MHVYLILIVVFILTDGEPCGYKCEWSPWRGWSECSRPCGGGNKNRYRGVCCRADLDLIGCLDDCKKDSDFYYGGRSQREKCNEHCYNGGTFVHHRTFHQYCRCGDLFEGTCCEKQKPRREEPDGMDNCKEICKWTQWENWSACSVTCGGGGQQERKRQLCCLEEYGGYRKCAAICGENVNDRIQNRSCGDVCLYGGSLKTGVTGCQCLDRSFGHCCEQLLPGCTPFPTDVVFVLDSSASQTKEQFAVQLDFVKKFVENVSISKEEFQIAVITYSTDARVEIDFDQSVDKDTLGHLIEEIQFRPGATFTNKGLNTTMEVVRKSERRKGMVTLTYAFVLTDGMSTKRTETKIAAMKLRNADVHVIAIGIGKEVSHQELVDIASPGDNFSQSYVFSVGDFNALDTLLKQLVKVTCDKCSNTSHLSDIIFLLDESNEMSETEFQISLDSITFIVKNTVRIGEQDGPVFGLFQLTKTLRTVIQPSGGQSQLNLMVLFQSLRRKQNDVCDIDEKCSGANITSAIDKIFNSFNGVNVRENSRKFLVVLSNGKFKNPSIVKEEMMAISKMSDVKLFVIGPGLDVYMDGLLSMAKEANHVYVTLNNDDTSKLDALKSEFTYNMCTKS